MITLGIAGNTIQGVTTAAATAITYTFFGDEFNSGTTDSFKVLAQGQLPTSAAALYTVPASTQTIVKAMQFFNTTAAVVNFTAYVNGAVAANSIGTINIPANGTAIWESNGWTVRDSNGATLSTSSLTLTGDVTGSGSGSIATTLATVATGATVGDASHVAQVVFNNKGLTTAATAVPIAITSAAVSGLTFFATLANLSGDVTTAGTGATTLASVATAGTTGDASHVAQVTIDAKGRTTTATAVPIAITSAAVSGLTFFATLANLSGDVTTSGTGATTLATVNANVGTFGTASNVSTVTVNAKGLVTAASNTPIAITSAAVSGLTFFATLANLSGDATTAGTGAVTFATVNANVGTFGDATHYSTFTVNAKGLITAASQLTFPAAGITALTGDVTATGPGSVAATLATVNANVGTFGSSSLIPVLTVNAKGLVTAVTTAAASGGVPSTRLINTTAPLSGGGDLSADRTLVISAATTSTAGSMSGVDKLKENNIWVDMAAERGFVGDDATLNDTAWTNFLASPPPLGSTIFFPAGTYRFANEVTLNQDKRWKFKGAGAQVTFLKTTSVTANIFNFTVAGFYTTWEDMGFLTTAVKTAGAAVAITGANNSGCDMRRLSFNGMFFGVDLQGAQSGNVSVFDSFNYGAPPVNGRMLRVNGSTINLVLQNSTSNCVPNAGAIAGTANIEINQSGAVQILGCDLIGGVNSLLINANQGGGTSVAAIYVTNTFFDQSSGSTVKITGANTSDRIKFTQCGIAAGVIGSSAFEVAGTGAGGVGSATAMPAGISLVDCDIYYAPGSSTASGVLINGCQDISIQNTRVTGFSGTGGAGMHVIGSASNQTRVRINGCRIGPNSNLTVNNLVGVQLDAGSSGLGALSITDNDMGGNGTAIVDNSTIAVGTSKNINNNAGTVAGTSTTLVSAAGITLPLTTETIILQLPIPPNALKVGTTFKFSMAGVSTTATLQLRVRIGTLGTVADAGLVQLNTSAANTAAGLAISGSTAVAVVGASGTHFGAAVITGGTSTSAPLSTASGTFATTSALFVTVTLAASAAGPVIRSGTLEILSPA